VSILYLASFWEMDSVQELATSRLYDLLSANTHAVKNILLGRRFENHKWLLQGYEALVRRHQSMTNEEAEEIGWLSAIAVFRLREQYPPNTSITSTKISTCSGCDRSIEVQYHYYCGYCHRSRSFPIPSPPVLSSDIVFKAFLDEFKEYESYASSRVSGHLCITYFI
jgi:hypothetical protein